MSLKGVRAVLFDAVGTILHPVPSAADVYVEYGRQLGSRRSVEDIAQRFRTAFREQEDLDRRMGWVTSEARERERWTTIVAQVLDDVADAQTCFQLIYEHFDRSAAWRLEEDAAQVIAGLAQRKLIVGMASNFDSRLRSVVAGFPALRPISFLAISSEMGWRKPARSFFDTIARSIDTPADQILLVGDDWENDFQGAKAAGFQSVLFDASQRQPSATPHRIARLSQLLPSAGS